MNKARKSIQDPDKKVTKVNEIVNNLGEEKKNISKEIETLNKN